MWLMQLRDLIFNFDLLNLSSHGGLCTDRGVYPPLPLPSPPTIQSVTKLTRKGFPGAGMLEDDKDIADKGQGLD